MTLEHIRRRQKIQYNKRRGKYIQLVNDYLGLCPYCQCDIRSNYTIDHIVPMTSSGGDGIDNLVPCCSGCNSQKNSLSLVLFLGTRTTNNVERYWKKVGNWHSV